MKKRTPPFREESSKKAEKILDILKSRFPKARSALNFSNPLELLLATILSAQCTDERVNKITPALFERFKTARDYADARLAEIEGFIRSINFYKNKARAINYACMEIVKRFNGAVPNSVEELTSLKGVGRKTANIVLSEAFGIDALAVDTHVKRVGKRLGFTDLDDPVKVEKDLTRIIPRKRWREATFLFILHGRNTCTAKAPKCPVCPVRSLCDYYRNKIKR